MDRFLLGDGLLDQYQRALWGIQISIHVWASCESPKTKIVKNVKNENISSNNDRIEVSISKL